MRVVHGEQAISHVMAHRKQLNIFTHLNTLLQRHRTRMLVPSLCLKLACVQLQLAPTSLRSLSSLLRCRCCSRWGMCVQTLRMTRSQMMCHLQHHRQKNSCLPVDSSATSLLLHFCSWKLFCRVCYPECSSTQKARKECSSFEVQAQSHSLAGLIEEG